MDIRMILGDFRASCYLEMYRKAVSLANHKNFKHNNLNNFLK